MSCNCRFTNTFAGGVEIKVIVILHFSTIKIRAKGRRESNSDYFYLENMFLRKSFKMRT